MFLPHLLSQKKRKEWSGRDLVEPKRILLYQLLLTQVAANQSVFKTLQDKNSLEFHHYFRLNFNKKIELGMYLKKCIVYFFIFFQSIIPTKERTSLFRYLYGTKIQLNVYGYPVTYGTMGTVLAAILAAFASRILLQEMNKVLN